jgi:hypothetical protein
VLLRVLLALVLRVLALRVLGQQLGEGEGELLLRVLGLRELQTHMAGAACCSNCRRL